MKPKENATVAVSSKGSQIIISANAGDAKSTSKVSPKGNIALTGDNKNVLAKAAKRHYWLQLDDANKTVYINPFNE